MGIKAQEPEEEPREKLSGASHSKLSLRLWLRMLSCVMVVEKHLRRQMVEQFDSTLPRFDVLSALDRRRSGISMSELSQSLMVSGGNVTGVIDRLITDGLVRREVDPKDRRSITVKMTPAGRRSFRKMAEIHEDWFDTLFATMSEQEVASVLEDMGHVRRAIDHGLSELQAKAGPRAKGARASR